MEKWQQQEALRMRFGVVARHPATLVVRQLFGASVAIMALLSITVPSLTPPNPGYVMLFWFIPLLVTTVPPLLAGEAMWQSIQARISLREIDDESTGGKLSLRSQPGMDRILEGLTDVRRHNILNSLLALTSVFLLGLATVITESTLVWYLSVLISMTFGFAHSFHSFFTSDAVRQQGDHMPCLVHHAPTHHPDAVGLYSGRTDRASLGPRPPS